MQFLLQNLAVLLSLQYATVNGQGDALVQPLTIDSSSGTLDTTLTIQYADFSGPGYSFKNTRLLNGSLPGPTLRLSAGDTLRILYENKLSAQPDAVSTGANEYHNPDHSNLHFHGGHVSGELPSDDIRMSIPPGDSYQYHTLFPANHMPGTHWIHPHLHGSSSLQVGGGAAGALIVQDPKDYLPSQVEDAQDILLFVQQISRLTLRKVSTEMVDGMLEMDFDRDAAAGDVFRLVNGQYQPELSMQPGEWQRWRIVYANWLSDKLDFTFINSSCEMQLLAKDGVYIADFPRAVNLLPIPTAGRADIMVRCPDSGTHIIQDFENKTLVTVSVSGSTVESENLEEWTPDYPAYMTDLTSTTVTEDCSCVTDVGVCENDDNRFCLNKIPYDPDVYMHTVKFGSLVERNLEGLKNHPYHQHVYPFQLVGGVGALPDADENVYFKTGDWHDVVMIGTNRPVKTRYRADVHDGVVMVHCHILTHEDHGTMSQELIIDGGTCECDARYIEPPSASPTSSHPSASPTSNPTAVSQPTHDTSAPTSDAEASGIPGCALLRGAKQWITN